jgi:hypothetical protein
VSSFEANKKSIENYPNALKTDILFKADLLHLASSS